MYSKRYFLTRVLEVQIATKRAQREHRGLPMTEIYRRYIERQYHISYATFNRWKTIPAALELSKLQKDDDK